MFGWGDERLEARVVAKSVEVGVGFGKFAIFFGGKFNGFLEIF